MTRRRHRDPWSVETVPAREIAPGDRVSLGGFDFTVSAVEPAGLALEPDGGAVAVRLDLDHPTGRRGRPRGFSAPAPLLVDREAPVARVVGAADWRGF